MTRTSIEVPLSGKAQLAKEFSVQLITDYDQEAEAAPCKDEKLGRSVLGPIKTAEISIVSARGLSCSCFDLLHCFVNNELPNVKADYEMPYNRS